MNWLNLTDPRTGRDDLTVHVNRRSVKHILQDHVTRECWEALLPPELVERLRQIKWDHVSDSALADCRALSEYLRAQAEASLRRPLLMMYRLSRTDFSEERWILILPCGAKLVLRIDSADDSCHLVTCYLPGSEFSRPFVPSKMSGIDHWRRTVCREVNAHCEWRPQVGIVPLDERDLPQRRGQRAETRTEIRFVTAEEWGFLQHQKPILWRGSLKPWSATDEQHRPAKRKRRLSAPRGVMNSSISGELT